ncbi:MAG: thioredoxin-dependent thiol peroxidase [Acholeplasmataceae bacterium]|jgi:peroxiredoxin Q/BCP|nr:thioredoxin-dependent thiol peroxidase [Acholeplasmataceae bacterium]
MLDVGTKVNDFSLLDSEGNIHTLSEHLGKKVVVYFYPKDSTPGCTTQACSFRDNYHEINRLNVVLYGISPDDSNSHIKFSEKYNLPFTLLSDPDHKVSKYFGAYGKKSLYGKIFDGMIRSTFIIDETGKIEKVWKKADAKTNADAVVKYLNTVK